MRAILFVAVLAVPLAGCGTSITWLSLPSGKAVPEWALHSSADADASEPKASRPRARTARRPASSQMATAHSAQPDAAPTNSASASMLPLSKDFREREEAAEERIRKRMNICNGC